ncbi:MAG: hypothetical protein R6X33_19395 [Candidatus Brocadiia bacterium]
MVVLLSCVLVVSTWLGFRLASRRVERSTRQGRAVEPLRDWGVQLAVRLPAVLVLILLVLWAT